MAKFTSSSKPVSVKNTAPKKIPLLTYVANAEDEVSSQSYTVIKYRKPLNRIGTVYIQREKADNAKDVVAILMSKNADIPFQDAKAVETVEQVLRAGPRSQWLLPASGGWRGHLYIRPDRVIGPQKSLKIMPPQWVEDRQRAMLGRKGDFATWKAQVADVCRHSSRLIFLMSVAFAAPLLKQIKRTSFWIHLYGPAKSGKTLSSLVVGSVIGIGTDQQLPTWNTTPTAFQETARLFNDGVLIIDELALLGKDAYSRVKEFTYLFGAGVETSRSRQSAYAVPPASALWSSILVSTGEHSVTALATKANQVRDAGELARTHDLPALVTGKRTIFDMRPVSVPRAKSTSWGRGQLHALRDSIAANHGHAIEPLIHKIREMGERVQPYVQKQISQFRKALGPLPKDGALRHAADNFGVIYAGSCIAIDADIVPWTKTEALNATIKCYQAFLSEASKEERLSERARKILLKKLELIDGPSKSGGASGVFSKNTEEGVLFAVTPKTFETWFPQSDRKALMREALNGLDQTGKLVRTQSQSRPPRGGHQWAVTWPKWCTQTGMRAFQFYDPR